MAVGCFMLSRMSDPGIGQLQQSNAGMAKPSLFKTSFCGASSVLVGLIIVLAFAFVYALYLNFEVIAKHLDFGTLTLLGVFGFIGFVFLIMGLSFVGLILAILSFILREKRPWLGLLGLLFNGSAFFWMVIIRFD